MLTMHEIGRLPTIVSVILDGSTGTHESVLRAFQILERVKDWLARGVPPDVVLDLIAEMEAGDADA